MPRNLGYGRFLFASTVLFICIWYVIALFSMLLHKAHLADYDRSIIVYRKISRRNFRSCVTLREGRYVAQESAQRFTARCL